MQLTDEDQVLLEGSFTIMSHLYSRLGDLRVAEARRDLSELDEKTRKQYARKDTKDTKYFDVVAEDAISLGDGFSGQLDLNLKVLGNQGVVITEECGRRPRATLIEHDTPVIISDPVDASAYLDDIIERLSQPGDPTETMGTLFRRESEEKGAAQLRRQACNSSLTMLRDNVIKYSIVMNLLTGDIFVGSPVGIFRGDIRSATSLGDVTTPVKFIEAESLNMLCYTREGKYEQNRQGTHLRFFQIDRASSAKIGPVGPLRFSNLVHFPDSEQSNIGVVAHNGEKIQEILPNIAMALFSGGRLPAYKLFCDSNYCQHRAGREMTPVIANSLFGNGLIRHTGIDLRFLNNYEYPSEFRDTTAIISSGNDAALTFLTGMVQRGYAIRIV